MMPWSYIIASLHHCITNCNIQCGQLNWKCCIVLHFEVAASSWKYFMTCLQCVQLGHGAVQTEKSFNELLRILYLRQSSSYHCEPFSPQWACVYTVPSSGSLPVSEERLIVFIVGIRTVGALLCIVHHDIITLFIPPTCWTDKWHLHPALPQQP